MPLPGSRTGRIFGEAVVAIDREAKAVTTALGWRFDYDKLVLATGSYPFVPPIPGADRPECLVYRTIDDLGLIRVQAQASRSAAVIGGGLLGLECANALRNLGLDTHVVASTLSWSSSARWGDVVTVDAACDRVGGSSFALRLLVRVGERPCCEVTTTYVLVDRDGPTRVPDDLRAAWA